MKFLCDRCKTRYSIGDDRVRGKILKIRCKNCANVITVREGMNALDEVAAADRRMRPTTAAPMASASAPAGSALASAFVAQMTTKPPPALEEEWYVSIDGDQQGPFSLAEAQKWIAAKPFDAELHCWSEGFDDWLLVEKVSHFRNLRKKPQPPARPATAAPPLPRVAPQRMTPPPEDMSEPKPLFAATMASLEKSAGTPSPAALRPAPGFGLPSVTTPKTPANGIAAKANGTGSAPVPRVASISAKAGSGPTRAGTQQGVGHNQSAGAQALAAAFDTSNDANESHTTVDAQAFNDEIATRAEPIAAKRTFDRIDAAVTEPPKTNGRADANHGVPELPDEDMLDIGEVSRVVKLADLAKMGSNAPGSTTRKVSRVPLSARATGSTPKFDPASLAAAASDPAIQAMQQPMGDAAPGENLVVAPVVAQAHRRGLIMLIGVAVLLLAGVAVALVFMLNSSDDGTGGGLGHTHEIDTSRPEDIVRGHMLPDGSGAGSALVQRPIIRHPVHPNGSNNNPIDDTPGTGTKIKSEEIEDMAGKNATGTQRCYMRAQRGAEGIAIQDLKKLTVTITIDKTGTVSDVQLSDHGTDSLGTCLSSMIKRWKFRESPGGLYRFVLAFAS